MEIDLRSNYPKEKPFAYLNPRKANQALDNLHYGRKIIMIILGYIRGSSQTLLKLINQLYYLFIIEKPEKIEPAEGQELCRVCSDIANGIHFGVMTCEGCKVNIIMASQFKRTSITTYDF